MKEKLTKLIDLKSIITLSVIITLEILIIKNVSINNDLFLLFSNIATMIITYYFSRKENKL